MKGMARKCHLPHLASMPTVDCGSKTSIAAHRSQREKFLCAAGRGLGRNLAIGCRTRLGKPLGFRSRSAHVAHL